MGTGSTDAERPRILLVDDDPENRALLRQLLESEGMSVVGEAGDGEQGVELTTSLLPDVVLMDLRMPGMGGIESTRRIKESVPTTQVVVITQYDGPHPTKSASQVGAYAYLVKGCSASLICDVVTYAWRLKQELDRAPAQAPDAPTGSAFRA